MSTRLLLVVPVYKKICPSPSDVREVREMTVIKLSEVGGGVSENSPNINNGNNVVTSGARSAERSSFLNNGLLGCC